MISIQPSQFLTSRQRRRLEAVAHNAKFEETKRRRMPLVVPQPIPAITGSRPEPLVFDDVKRTPLPGAVQLMLALMAKTMSMPHRFRGYVMHGSSPRAQARAAGYSNVREMQALQRADALRAKVAAEAAEAAAT